ncbi:MAG: hypothetical protein V2A34_12550 [Lentisphaerota bacterium]
MTGYRVIADLHVHFYPFYNLEAAMRSAFQRLSILAGAKGPQKTIKIVGLAERSDCHFFRDLKARTQAVKGFSVSDFPEDENSLSIRADTQGDELLLLAGRQIVTSERLEVVALTADMAPSDGQPVRTVLDQIRKSGAVPCINWAPGKWLGPRGKIIASLIRGGRPGDFVLGDTTLRPSLCGEPGLMREARKKGFVVIAGSDPLPFAGEENKPGVYGSLWETEFDPAQPAESLRKLLLTAPSPRLAGRRDSVSGVFRRLWKNRQAKRK